MSLPNETLSAIFNELPSSTLAVLACVSFRFNAVAERILYSSISILDSLSESSPHPLRTLWWCEAMRRRPHLIDTTRKLQIRWQADVSTPAPHYLVNTCERLGQVIPQFIALESLDLSLGPANLVTSHTTTPMHALERIIHSCHFAHLRSCSLSAERTKGVSPYTTILGTFLASLPVLRHLKLADLHTGVESLPLDALPLLTSFRGSPDAAASILPGRPVQSLSLIGEDSDVNRDNFPRMTRTTLPLRCLDLSAMSARPALLRIVSTYLPAIESLRVKLALRHTLHYSFSGIRILAGLSSVLRAFTRLSFLDLSPTSVDGVGNAYEELTICIEWHRVCPTLKRIIFPSQTQWMIDLNDTWTLTQS